MNCFERPSRETSVDARLRRFVGKRAAVICQPIVGREVLAKYPSRGRNTPLPDGNPLRKGLGYAGIKNLLTLVGCSTKAEQGGDRRL